MDMTRFARWLEVICGLIAGVLGLLFLRYLLLAFRGPGYDLADASTSARLGLLIAGIILLSIGVAGAFVDGRIGRRLGRVLLWGSAIPLLVIAILGSNLTTSPLSSLLFAALLILAAAALSLLAAP